MTSYTELRRDAADRANAGTCCIQPRHRARVTWKKRSKESKDRSSRPAITFERLGEQLTPWIPGDYYVLGTDGMGRSETREALRRHFEVDAESITIATLSRLAKAGVFTPKDVKDAISELGYDAEKPDPYFA